MLKQFEELPENVQALMLAKLAIEMKAAKAHSIYHLARVQKSDVSDLWRDICRKARNRFAQFQSELWKTLIRMNLAITGDQRKAQRF